MYNVEIHVCITKVGGNGTQGVSTRTEEITYDQVGKLVTALCGKMDKVLDDHGIASNPTQSPF